MPRDECPPVLTDDELMALSMSAIRLSGDKGITTPDVFRVCEWAHNARVDALMLQMVLDGQVDIGWNGTEVVFGKRGDDHAA